MTVPLHSTQFFLGTISGAGPTNLYTVPTGTRAVIKQVSIQNAVSSAKTCSVGVNLHGNFVTVTIASGANYQLATWIVVNAGDTIAQSASTGSVFMVSVAGYLYPITL